ncbi:MAG: M48 family metalloprotease [Pseudomonadota bacterium]
MSLLKKTLAGIALLTLFGVAPACAGGMNLLRDEEIEQALKTMSLPVFNQTGLDADTIKFVLVDDPEMNAFVAGGRNIFLHTGLILETQTPAELAGVIAHEAGHIADGHLFRAQAEISSLSLQAMLANLLGVAVAIGTPSPDAGVAIGSLGANIANRDFLRHTRTQEGSADQAGTRYLQKAGLPVSGFLSFMKKLSSQELLPESRQSQYVRTHPMTQDRIDFLQHVVDENPQAGTPPAWDELHRRMRAKLEGYLFPDRALREKDDSAATQYGRAIAWFRKGKLDKALAVLDPLLKAEPKNPYFHELRGQMLFENGRIEEAVPAYAQAAKLAPFSGLIRIAYAHSLLESKANEKERVAEAIRQLTRALGKEKQMSGPHYLLAVAYGKQGQTGLSNLHLAEEELMQNNPVRAKRAARLALSGLKKSTPAYQRTLDILAALEKKEKNPEKND